MSQTSTWKLREPTGPCTDEEGHDLGLTGAPSLDPDLPPAGATCFNCLRDGTVVLTPAGEGS